MAPMTVGCEISDPALGIILRIDEQQNTVTVSYRRSSGEFAFTATLNISESPLQNRLREICAEHRATADTRALSNAKTTRLTQRLFQSLQATSPSIQRSVEWTIASNEHTNYTYELKPLNILHLADIVALATNTPRPNIEQFLLEPAADHDLNTHYKSAVAALPKNLASVADTVPRWARRLGWYAVVRATKPKFVVETGVDKGLGALILCAALSRNAAEGHQGRYVGTDINPAAGYLLRGAYAQYGRIVYGDSLTSLQQLKQPIDVFINDSDHSSEYEYAEYLAIAELLHNDSILLGDNAHVTDKLRQFAHETSRRFLFFREEPLKHWYPGAGIGFAFR